MKYWSVIFVHLLFIFPLQAKDRSQFGMELDALPWLTGGHYISAWYSPAQIRYRAVAAKINVPDAFVEQGFKDKTITAYALIADYFPDRSRQGIWYGAGLEYWQSSLRNQSDNASAEYNNTIFTAGLGYVWHISDAVYLNPWAALHLVVAGDDDIRVGDRTYHQERLTPSGSVKLGWAF